MDFDDIPAPWANSPAGSDPSRVGPQRLEPQPVKPASKVNWALIERIAFVVVFAGVIAWRVESVVKDLERKQLETQQLITDRFTQLYSLHAANAYAIGCLETGTVIKWEMPIHMGGPGGWNCVDISAKRVARTPRLEGVKPGDPLPVWSGIRPANAGAAREKEKGTTK